jgi:hypothetical protein
MFVIVYQGNVILGPMRWHPRRFTEVIEEDCGIQYVFEWTNDNMDVVHVSEDIIVYPVQQELPPNYNIITEQLSGPFYEFTDTVAISSWQVVQLPLEGIKNTLRNSVANVRWQKQTTFIDVEINGTTYTFSTDDASRSMFHQYVTSGITQLNWKIDQDHWIILTDTDIQTIFTAITQHIQSCFDWEVMKNTEISNATLENIESIDLRN